MFAPFKTREWMTIGRSSILAIFLSFTHKKLDWQRRRFKVIKGPDFLSTALPRSLRFQTDLPQIRKSSLKISSLSDSLSTKTVLFEARISFPSILFCNKLLPNRVESIAPTILKPLTKATWKYTNPSSLATSGINYCLQLQRHKIWKRHPKVQRITQIQIQVKITIIQTAFFILILN